jgi:hypothetical protein
MTTIPRAAVRAFAAVVRKARGREPDPPALLTPDAGGVTLLVRLPALAVAYRVPADPSGSGPVAVPLDSLAAAAAAADDAVSVEPQGDDQVVLRWSERGQARSSTVENDRPAEGEARPALPKTLAAMPPELLAALHEAGRTAGRSDGRYALDHIQLLGRAGAVVASDGHTAFLQGGFRFPFKDGLLVPATPAFGTAELRGETDLRLGRTDAHVVVAAGLWTFWWAIRRDGTYPDVAAVLPASFAATLELDEADAAELLARLPKLPGGRDERRPVTLDLAAGSATVRAASPSEGHAEVRLERSTCQGEPVRVAVDRAYLARALKLGCRTLQVKADDRPVVARRGSLTFVGGALDPSCVVDESVRERGLAVIAPAPAEAEPARGLAAVDVAPVPAEVSAPVDPLAEAEALGTVLIEAGQRLGRLVGWFQARRRGPGAVGRVWSRLQSLARPQGGAP